MESYNISTMYNLIFQLCMCTLMYNNVRAIPLKFGGGGGGMKRHESML